MTRTGTMPETVRWSPSPGFSGSTSGPEGTAARLGGDELVAVLAEVAGLGRRHPIQAIIDAAGASRPVPGQGTVERAAAGLAYRGSVSSPELTLMSSSRR
jgi:hypothetical protein